MSFEDCLKIEVEDIIETKHCMLELVDMALGRRIKPHSFDLKQSPWTL
jgi:hypothetical protein